MNSIAPYIASPITIGLVVFGLITWAVASGYRLHVATRKLLAEIVRARGQVEETDGASTFKGKYEAVAESLGDNPVLGPRWREYQHSLWISDSGMIRATTRSDDWFNLDLLRSPVIGIDPGYHAALPGLLVGAGLLFTFIGLAVALGSAGGIVADNVTQAQRNSALHDLLGAASLKFWTSVAGLLMSICYALYRKYRLHRVELALEAFQAALDTRIPIITQVQMQAESNSHLASQTTAMQSFSNDLAINLAGVFDNAFDRRLGEHIAPLTTAMQQLAESLTARNEDTMEKMLGVFLDKLKGDTGNQMAGVADKLAALANGLEGLQTGMQEAARRMAEAADAMARRMGEGAEEAMAEVTRQMSSLVETLRKLAENSRSMGTTALAAVAGRIDSAASSFEGVSERIAKVNIFIKGRKRESRAAELLDSAGVDLANVAFVQAQTDRV